MGPAPDRQVPWWDVHTYVTAVGEHLGRPIGLGTPAWCALADDDPAKTAALLDASSIGRCGGNRQQAECEASHAISAAADWSAIARNIKDRNEFYAARPWLKRVPHDRRHRPSKTCASRTEDDPDVIRAHLGMAVKLADQFAGKLLYVEKVGWHRWDGARWAPGGASYARRAVHTVIKRDRVEVEQLAIPNKERAKLLRGYSVSRPPAPSPAFSLKRLCCNSTGST